MKEIIIIIIIIKSKQQLEKERTTDIIKQDKQLQSKEQESGDSANITTRW